MASSSSVFPGGGFCASGRLVIHILDASFITLVVGLQGGTLNYYLIMLYGKENVGPYFYFLADLMTVGVFIGTLTRSYTYLTKTDAIAKLLPENALPARIIQEVQARLPHCHRFWGILPLSYISWLIYASVLLSKIIFIFERENIVNEVKPGETLGPNLLKITIGVASLVFLSLAEGHNWSKRGTERYSFVTSTCAKNGIEVFDAVEFLALQFNEKTSADFALKQAVLYLSIMAFILPALSLFQLSWLDFASKKACLQISVTQHVLRLLLVDLPFLAVRIYLWVAYKESASLFLLKNIFNIIVTSRTLCPEVKAMTEEHIGNLATSIEQRLDSNRKSDEEKAKSTSVKA